MKRLATFALFLLPLLAQQPAQPPAAAPAPGRAGAGRGGRGGPPVQAKPEELAKLADKSGQIESIVKELRAKHVDPALIGDVEVYAKAGRFLVEFPELFGTQNAIDHSTVVLDQGIERGGAHDRQHRLHLGRRRADVATVREVVGIIVDGLEGHGILRFQATGLEFAT